MKKQSFFNFNKKVTKNFALINGSIIDPENGVLKKSSLLIKDKLIEDFGNHIKPDQLSKE